MEPVPITLRLRRAQGASNYRLYLLHKIGKVEVFARYRLGQLQDVAVVRGSLTAHGPTAPLALAALRALLRERQAMDRREFTWQAGLDAGCTAETLAAFCALNGLKPEQTITLGELRRTVTAQRAANQPYARQLSRIGIQLGRVK